MMIKMKGKKGVSLIISYVLLVTIAIIMSIIVFSYLRYVANVEPVIDCKEGTSIVVENYVCNNGIINLTLRNNGRFNVDGFVPTFGGNVQREPTTKLVFRNQSSLALLDSTIPTSPPHDPPKFKNVLKPGEVVHVWFSNKEKKASGEILPINFEFIRNLKVQPFIIDDESDLTVPCGEGINRQDLEGCQVKAGVVIPEPVAYYTFEGNFEDSISDNHLTTSLNKNNPDYVTSLFGQAVEFNPDKGLRTNNLDDDLNDNEISISFWAIYEDGYLLQRKNSGSSQSGVLLRGSKTQLEWFAGGLVSGKSYVNCEGVFNNWRHITLTAKMGEDKKIYVDGDLCSSLDTGNEGMDSSNYFVIGSNVGLTGQLDELKIWDVELSEEEVASLYSSYIN